MTIHQRERLATALRGRYAVEAEIGQGGMAVVYRARDLKHDRPVAIKVLKPQIADQLGADRFLREIKLTAQLRHPHILPLLDSGDADGLLYYVMPFVEGESLRQRLDRGRPLPLEEALRLTREIADGLDSAHRHGVIHRDIKPENILLEDGHAVIADFGIARALAESADDRLTITGIAVGTPAYMSPEQMLGGRAGPIDARTDVYALACVLNELLTGGSIPEDVNRVIRRGMSSAPEERYATAAEFAAALPRERVRRPLYLIPVTGLVLFALVAIIVPRWTRASQDRGREQLTRAQLLADSGRWPEAYALLSRAERSLPGDNGVGRLMIDVADVLNVTSEPADARVYMRRFDGTGDDDSTLLGETPIRGRRVARGAYRLSIAKDGFAPVEAVPSTFVDQGRLGGMRVARPWEVSVRLAREDSTTRDMVFVPGGTYQLMGPDMPSGLRTDLADYFIDKYEVSNAQYRAFVASGGYRGDLARLRDRTGMPGPRGWTGQEYPVGRDRYPVTGVSWLEASAYCAAQRKRLPTAFEWEKAARNGFTARGEGVMMPWGYVGPGDPTEGRANFGGRGPAPVDAYPLGVSAYGVYNMAGNVKEWTANPVLDGYGVTGGSWEDPIYLYSAYGAGGATMSAPTLGFRCARVAAAQSGRDQGAFRIRSEARTPRYTPVAPGVYAALLQHYRYDHRPLEAEVLDSVATPDWTRLKLRYIALEGDTALAYLYLPKQAAAPFQTMVYVSSSAAFFQIRSVADEVELYIGPNIRAGRAALGIVFRGMAERGFGPGWEPPAPSSVRFRDLMVLHATELRRAVDYLATRDDIDMQRLSYIATSWGAGSRLTLAAVEDRFRAYVLIGAGIDERVQPTLPEAANFNFAPYIRPPKLVVNGRDDEEHPWFTRALPLWNLLREPKELVLVPGAGHVPPSEARVPAINRFLDQVLGPVRRRP